MWKQRIANLNFLSLCILSCFPVLNMKVTVIAIIVFSTLSVISGVLHKEKILQTRNWNELLIFLLPFTLIFIRTWLMDKSEESLFYMEVSLSLLAFPVAFFLYGMKSNADSKNIPAWLFTCSTLVVVFYGQVKAILHVATLFGSGKTWETYSQMFKDAAFPYQLRTVFEEAVTIHPTHASIFLGISILIIINSLFKNFEIFSARIKALLFTILILAIVMLAILASRTPFMATMLAGLLLSFFHFRKKIYVAYALGAVILLSLLLIFLVPSFSERFREISWNNAQVPSENEENSFNLRTGIYKCSINTIKQNWLWGVGPGNVQQSLNTCYDHISKEVYFEKNYNTHNQFLDYWAGLGIMGPISLLLVFGWFISVNYKTRNYLAISLALLFFLSMLTENLLTRQNGVVPFAFFIGLYFYSGSSSEERHTRTQL